MWLVSGHWEMSALYQRTWPNILHTHWAVIFRASQLYSGYTRSPLSPYCQDSSSFKPSISELPFLSVTYEEGRASSHGGSTYRGKKLSKCCHWWMPCHDNPSLDGKPCLLSKPPIGQAPPCSSSSSPFPLFLPPLLPHSSPSSFSSSSC